MPWYTTGDDITLIGVSGKARSGKDYLAKHSLKGLGFLPMAFANHFKVDAITKDGADFDEVFGHIERTPEVRSMLQKRGTEEGRHVYGHDIWVKTVEAWLAFYEGRGFNRFVVTDVRFPNEADWIKSMGGTLFRIFGRGGAENKSTQQHTSETALDGYTNFDVYINNSEDTEEVALTRMRAIVLQILEEGYQHGRHQF